MSYRTAINLKQAGSTPESVRVEPESALVISRATGVAEPIISQHEIIRSSGKHTIARGNVVTLASVMRMLEAQGLRQPMTWCDDTMLAIGNDGFAWHRPSRIAPMWWLVGTDQVSLRVRWPHLIFVVSRAHEFRVYAHAGSDRPKPTDTLYLPPLGNIYDDARLCWGSIKQPQATADARGEFEDAIYKSNFTHPNANVLSKAGAKGLRGIAGMSGDLPDLFTYWKRRAGRSPAAVPREHLRATKLKLRDLL